MVYGPVNGHIACGAELLSNEKVGLGVLVLLKPLTLNGRYDLFQVTYLPSRQQLRSKVQPLFDMFRNPHGSFSTTQNRNRVGLQELNDTGRLREVFVYKHDLISLGYNGHSAVVSFWRDLIFL